MKKPRNPYAFPSEEAIVFEDEANKISNSGMTLRDYFAAKAMQALLNDSPILNYDNIAEMAYKQANSMLEEREK